jgi:hypothetical protein
MRQAFPNETGFSYSNVKYMKQWYSFYYERVTKGQLPIGLIGHQAGGELEVIEKGQQVADQINGVEKKGQRVIDQLKCLSIWQNTMASFYLIHQHSYVVIELKVVTSIPELLANRISM